MAHQTCAEALRMLLDHVDNLADPPACGITEVVGAALPREVIRLCHEALDGERRSKQSPDESIEPFLHRSGFR
jgi:hypothetical protein